MTTVTQSANLYEHIHEPDVLDADPRADCFNRATSRVQISPGTPRTRRWTEPVVDAFGIPRGEKTVSWTDFENPVYEERAMPPPIQFYPLCRQHFHGGRGRVESLRGARTSEVRRSCFKCLRILAKTYAPMEDA